MQVGPPVSRLKLHMRCHLVGTVNGLNVEHPMFNVHFLANPRLYIKFLPRSDRTLAASVAANKEICPSAPILLRNIEHRRSPVPAHRPACAP